MSCQHCGDCCLYATLLIPKGTGDQQWLELHSITIIEERPDGDLIKIPIRCKALAEDNRCLVYENRPTTCRKYHCAKSILDDFDTL